MAWIFLAAALAWPAWLVSGTVARVEGRAPWLVAGVYLSASQVCHQRVDRSFHSHGVPWPVCGRCTGLYLAAPLGALAALRRRRGRTGRRDVIGLAAAAVPTALTFALEQLGAVDVSTWVRCAAALPLGTAVAWVIVHVARGPAHGIG